MGTSIIMTERSEERSTTDFWYYKVQEKVSRIDLNEFTRMSGDEEYSYDMESTEYNSLDYQFMADFEESEEKAEEGLYQLGFIASDSSEEVKVCQMELEVQVVPGKTYDLEIRESEEREETPKVTVTCKTEDPREEIAQKEKTFALVLTGTGETELPEDARLKVGKENTGPAEKTVLSCRLVICKMKIPTGNLLYFLTCFRKKKKSTILQRSFAGQIHSQKAGF